VDDDTTGSLSLRLRSPMPPSPAPDEDGLPAQITRRELRDLRLGVAKLLETDQREAGARMVWRGLGATASAVALALGAGALNLASTASSDHERLDRVESGVGANAERVSRSDADNRTRSEALLNRLTDIRISVTRIEAAIARDERTPR